MLSIHCAFFTLSPSSFCFVEFRSFIHSIYLILVRFNSCVRSSSISNKKKERKKLCDPCQVSSHSRRHNSVCAFSYSLCYALILLYDHLGQNAKQFFLLLLLCLSWKFFLCRLLFSTF